MRSYLVTSCPCCTSRWPRCSANVWRKITFFPQGTELEPVAVDGTLARLGLEAGKYLLYVSRLERRTTPTW
jgi:hypothetical protein